jgi:predicted nuclease with RNAse H fold
VIVLGIDLSGRSTGVTAAAVLEGRRFGRPRLTTWEDHALNGRRGDARLVEFARQTRPRWIAIDAPLTLPHTITCRDSDCRRCFPAGDVAPSYGSRALDGRAAWVARGYETKEPMPTAMIAAVAFRGIYLRRLLRRHGFDRVIETWPMGVYRALERASDSRVAPATDDAWRRRQLQKVVDGVPGDRSAGKLSRDSLDAVAAAYAAWCRAERRADRIAAQDAEDEGEIWIPRPARGARGAGSGRARIPV